MSLQISIDQQRELFKKHLDDEFNDRIIFSGAFGIGKTYFLDKYFSGEDTDYLAIRLAPVNYSISSNEDIFKLIKYDILFELGMKHGLTFQAAPVDRGIAYGTLLPGKLKSIVDTMLPLLALLNKPTDSIPLILTALNALIATAKEIEEQRKATGVSSDALTPGNEVVKAFQHETDYATEFIEENLQRLSVEKEAKLKVLIIDDLDRIDPEHIFRLFNIFSAHFDYNKTFRNKFGFDKVIFVCDVHNIRNIFHTQYGTDTDFTGYIDKFFSQEVYFFSNEHEVYVAVDSFINAIVAPSESARIYLDTHIKQGRNNRAKGIFSVILTELILSGALRMRRLIANYGLRFDLSDNTIEVYDRDHSREVHHRQVPSLIILQLLSKIMGGGQALANGLKTLRRAKRSAHYHEATSTNSDLLIGAILVVVDYPGHKFKTTNFVQKSMFSYRGIDGVLIDYYLTEGGSQHDYYFANLEGMYSSELFFVLVQKAVESLLNDGILK